MNFWLYGTHLLGTSVHKEQLIRNFHLYMEPTYKKLLIISHDKEQIFNPQSLAGN